MLMFSYFLSVVYWCSHIFFLLYFEVLIFSFCCMLMSLYFLCVLFWGSQIDLVALAVILLSVEGNIDILYFK
jgi:hypothetical protein